MKTALPRQGLGGRHSVNVSASVSSHFILQEALQGPAYGKASSPAQVTPTSSLWAQLCFPQGAAGQSARAASVPAHLTSSSQMGPAPQPKRPAVGSGCRGPPQPSSRQTTAASRRSQPSSHTVPQRPACHTSSRPEHLLGPATRRSWGDPGVGGTQRIRGRPSSVFPPCIHPEGDPSWPRCSVLSSPLSSEQGGGTRGAAGGGGQETYAQPHTWGSGEDGGSPASGPGS